MVGIVDIYETINNCLCFYGYGLVQVTRLRYKLPDCCRETFQLPDNRPIFSKRRKKNRRESELLIQNVDVNIVGQFVVNPTIGATLETRYKALPFNVILPITYDIFGPFMSLLH